MTCEDLRQEYDAYALGISEGAELAALREHLAVNCPVCVPGVQEALRFAASLGAGVAESNPPAGLRRRVAAMVEDPRSAPSTAKLNWTAWLAIGLAAALASLTFITMRSTERKTEATEALSLLSTGDVKQLAVQQISPRVDVFASRSRGVLLLASNFRPAPAGKVYEMWLIAKDSPPAPAGLFTPRNDGSVLHISKPLARPLAAVALTIEPEGGSDHPTSTPFLVATP